MCVRETVRQQHHRGGPGAGPRKGQVARAVRGIPLPVPPADERLMSLLDGGELGALERVESTMFMPAPSADDPRWSLDLAGGALMDLGCYALHAQRVLGDFAGGEPRLVDATGAERAGAPGVDEWTPVHLEFPSGATGLARCSIVSEDWDMAMRAVGSAGEASFPTSSTRGRRPDHHHSPGRENGPSTAAANLVHLPAQAFTTPSATARRTAPTPMTRWRTCRSSTPATAPSGSSPARALDIASADEAF